MQAHDYISNVSGSNRTLESCSAFTLVEIALAIAVLAIGLLGTLVLFPVGLDATRTASDNTEVTTIADEYLSIYQQASLNPTNYAYVGSPGILSTDVLVAGTSPLITNWVDFPTSFYLSRITVGNGGFAQIRYGTAPSLTNAISRVIIDIWRPGGNTNTYVTEVARYALP